MPMIELYSNGKPTGKAVDAPKGWHVIKKDELVDVAQREREELVKKAMGVED